MPKGINFGSILVGVWEPENAASLNFSILFHKITQTYFNQITSKFPSQILFTRLVDNSADTHTHTHTHFLSTGDFTWAGSAGLLGLGTRAYQATMPLASSNCPLRMASLALHCPRTRAGASALSDLSKASSWKDPQEPQAR